MDNDFWYKLIQIYVNTDDKDIIDTINTLLDNKNESHRMNEMPITYARSGNLMFDKPQDINTIIDKCEYIYQTNKEKDFYYAETRDLRLKCIFPLNQKPIDEPITIIYGNDKIGIKHIFNNRGLEYKNRNETISEELEPKEIISALKNLPHVLKYGDVLLDFDLKDVDNKIHRKISHNIQPIPYSDRIIIDDKANNLFYIILIKGFDGKTDLTCLMTLFKPKYDYRKRIENLNKAFKIQNLKY